MKYEFLTVEETAKILKVTKMTIYRYIKAKKLTAFKVGRDYRVKQDDFNNFLLKNKTGIK